MPWVLTALSIGAGAVIFLFSQQRNPASLLAREQKHRQAFYLAEAGVALQLHRERFFDSAQRALEASETPEAKVRAQLDSIRFFLDSSQSPPTVRVDRGKVFLEIRSSAAFGPESVSIRARFGRALDPEMFGAALTLGGSTAMRPFQPGQVRGAVRLRAHSEEIASLPWPADFRGTSYGDAFIETKYHLLEYQLRTALSLEGAQPGNGDYTMAYPPPLGGRGQLAFPLGDVTLRHDGSEYWVIEGPAVFAAKHDIRVRGRVRLKNVTLLCEGAVHLEGEAEAEDVTVFAIGPLVIQEQAKVEGLFLSGNNLFVKDRAEVKGHSLLLQSSGNSADSTLAIRIVNEAKVRGFAVATGALGKIVLGGPRNAFTGVLMAQELWLAGTVRGSVVGDHLRCGPAAEGAQCLGDAVIDREALPDDFVQPWDFGLLSDRSKLRFKLLAWESL